MVRGVLVTYETIRQWCQKFGQTFANDVRRRRARPGDKWHLDEVFLKINGQTQYLWRAVDQDGIGLDILVQPHRDKAAAKRFFRKLLKGLHYELMGSGSSIGQLSSSRPCELDQHFQLHPPSAYTRAGAPDAALQISRSCPALPLCPGPHCVPLPPWPAPAARAGVPPADGPVFPDVASSDEACLPKRLTRTPPIPQLGISLRHVKLS